MIGKLGLPEILIILAIALLIFGPSKLADLGKGLGEGIKNFKSAVKDGEDRTRSPSASALVILCGQSQGIVLPQHLIHQRHWKSHHVEVISLDS